MAKKYIHPGTVQVYKTKHPALLINTKIEEYVYMSARRYELYGEYVYGSIRTFGSEEAAQHDVDEANKGKPMKIFVLLKQKVYKREYNF